MSKCVGKTNLRVKPLGMLSTKYLAIVGLFCIFFSNWTYLYVLYCVICVLFSCCCGVVQKPCRSTSSSAVRLQLGDSLTNPGSECHTSPLFHRLIVTVHSDMSHLNDSIHIKHLPCLASLSVFQVQAAMIFLYPIFHISSCSSQMVSNNYYHFII